MPFAISAILIAKGDDHSQKIKMPYIEA